MSECWKQAFTTAQDAHKHFKDIRGTVSVYRCKNCKMWHATNVKNDRFQMRSFTRKRR